MQVHIDYFLCGLQLAKSNASYKMYLAFCTNLLSKHEENKSAVIISVLQVNLNHCQSKNQN